MGQRLLQKDLAEELGVTPRAIRDWRQEPYWPSDQPGEDGLYDLDVVRDYQEQLGKKGSDDSELARDVKIAREKEKLKQDRIKTEIEELKLKEQQRELLQRRSQELHFAVIFSHLGGAINEKRNELYADMQRRAKEEEANRND